MGLCGSFDGEKGGQASSASAWGPVRRVGLGGEVEPAGGPGGPVMPTVHCRVK